jgi:hypothetical protein
MRHVYFHGAADKVPQDETGSGLRHLVFTSAAEPENLDFAFALGDRTLRQVLESLERTLVHSTRY